MIVSKFNSKITDKFLNEAIEDHFDKSVELEMELEKNNKNEMLEMVRNISNMANIHFIRQIASSRPAFRKDPRGWMSVTSFWQIFIEFGFSEFRIQINDDSF